MQDFDLYRLRAVHASRELSIKDRRCYLHQRPPLYHLQWQFFLQFFVSPTLTGFVLSIVPPVILCTVIYGRYMKQISKQVQDSLADATQVSYFKVMQCPCETICCKAAIFQR